MDEPVAIYVCNKCGRDHNDPNEWLCKYCKNGDAAVFTISPSKHEAI